MTCKTLRIYGIEVFSGNKLHKKTEGWPTVCLHLYCHGSLPERTWLHQTICKDPNGKIVRRRRRNAIHDQNSQLYLIATHLRKHDIKGETTY